MTDDDIMRALLSDNRVYLHYTDAAGASAIRQTGVIRTNTKLAVYLTQEPMSEAEAHQKLFIGATTHEGRGSHVVVLRISAGLPVRRLSTFEFASDQTIRLDQHQVLYIGPNPTQSR